jgi:hypothetical protein
MKFIVNKFMESIGRGINSENAGKIIFYDKNGKAFDIEFIQRLEYENEKLKKELEKVKGERDKYFKIHADSQHEAMNYAAMYSEVKQQLTEFMENNK